MIELMESDQRVVIDKLMEQTQKALLMSENDIASVLFQTYQKQLNIVIKDLLWLNQTFLDGQDKTLTRWRALQLDTASLRMISNHMSGLNQMVATNLIEDLTDFAQKSYSMTSWAVDQSVPPQVPTSWNLPTDDVIKSFIAAPWKGQMFSDRIGEINNKMARQLQESLVDGIMSGDSIADIARSMRSNVGIPEDEKLITRPRASKQVYRALTIARSEAMRLNGLMRDRIYNENKKIMADRVLAVAPGFLRVCDECAEKDGMTYEEIEEEFGDPETPFHPNCRCLYFLKPKPFQDLLPDSLKAAGKGVFEQSIEDYEMKTYSPDDAKMVSMKVTPYDEWMTQE